MARRKTTPVCEPALIFEPRIAVIPVRRDLTGRQSSNGLLSRKTEELRVDEGFGRQSWLILIYIRCHSGAISDIVNTINSPRGRGAKETGL